MKKIVGLAITILVIVSLYLYRSHAPEKKFLPSQPVATIKLLPFPILINEDGSKNDSPLELLLHKIKEPIVILDGNVEFSNIPPFGSLLSYKKASMHFAYDEKENKVKFSGKINNAQNSNVSGDYFLGDNNNIVYNLNISSDFTNVILNGTYNYQSSNEETLVGNFAFSTADFIKFLDYSLEHSLQKLGINTNQTQTIAINGDYSLQEASVKISNCSIKSELVDGSLDLDFNNEQKPGFNAVMNINNLDLDKMIHFYDLAKLDQHVIKLYLSNFFNQLLTTYTANDQFATKIQVSNINYKNDHIKNGSFEAKSTNSGFAIPSLNFTLPGEANFSSAGKAITNGIRPEYQGKISLKTKDLKHAMHFVLDGDELIELQDNIYIDAIADLRLTPIYTEFTNVTINNAQGAVTGKFNLADYGRQKVLHSDINVSNQTISFEKLLKQNPFSNLVKKSNQSDFTDRVMQLKSLESVHDIDINLNNVVLNNNLLQNASAEFLLRPSSMQLTGIKAKANNLKFNGDITVDTHGITPFIEVNLQGDNFDPNFIKYLTYEKTEDLAETKAGSSAQPQSKNLSLFRFDKFAGYIQLNFKKLQNSIFSATDFSFYSSLKDGVMNIEKCEVAAYEGNVSVLGNIVFMPPTLNLSYTLQNLNAKSFAQNIFGTDIVSGDLTISGTAYTSGLTPDDIEKQLNGEFTVTSNNIIVDHFNIESFTAVHGTPHDSATNKQLGLTKGSTHFRVIDGKIKVNQGLFSTEKLDFETSANVNGATNFNYFFPTNEMNSITSLAYVNSEGKIDGFNVAITGPLNDLKMQLGSGSK